MNKEQGGFEFEERSAGTGPVECLGMTFASEEARREHFLQLLAEKLKDPAFRAISGFPHATDQQILRLSDPPYYTACPNPFLDRLLTAAPSTEKSLPIIGVLGEDVAAGKHGRLYNVHPYHTKVPPEAIEPLIRHYSRPGDTILDPFAGTGMTGVAAAAVSASEGGPPRSCILVDLGPAATFIAANYNSLSCPTDIEARFAKALQALKDEFGNLYNTKHTGWPAQTFSESEADAYSSGLRAGSTGMQQGTVEYVVWSEVLLCPHCGVEFSYWDAAVEFFECRVDEEFPCPGCRASLQKNEPDRAAEVYFDTLLQYTSQRTKRIPVLLSYRVGRRRYEKRPDESDLALLSSCDTMASQAPVAKMCGIGAKWGDTWRAGVHFGITHAHHFFTNRTLAVLAAFALEARHPALLFALTACAYRLSRLNRYMPQHRNNRSREVVGPLSGTLYVPRLSLEVNPISLLESKRSSLSNVWRQRQTTRPAAYCSTQSSESLHQIPDSSIDYVFLDPPFGANLFYAELSSLWEAWLGVTTARSNEAVVSPATGKGLGDYAALLTASLTECYRVLKPGRWLTMEFHNSKNAVWSAIAEAIQLAGFCIADVSVLDKKKGTTKQLSYKNTVNKDLIISAYKPAQSGHGNQFDETPMDVWTWLRYHLAALHVPTVKRGDLQPNPERQSDLLFDRMVAYHVARGWRVPVSAPEFYAGLSERYPTRDSMYFLPEQVGVYDKVRATVGELRQLTLFVTDEASAVQWLRQQLQRRPQTFQELQPQFMQQLQAWSKHEKTVELKEILTLNFLTYEGHGPVPSQIHSYLSSNFKELRKLEKEDPTLQVKAKNRWYVPDPKKEGDLEKLRMRTMLKEFDEYKTSTQRKLKQLRTEALRAGFKAAYDAGDYETIVAVAEKTPEKVLQEDDKLLMYYDVAKMRLGEDG